MSRIDDLIAEYCPDGVKHQTLGEIGEFIRGNGIQKRDFQDSGFGCIHYGQIYTYYAYLPIIRSRSLTQTWLKTKESI